MSDDLIPISETAAFDLVLRQAEVLSQAGTLPDAYRGKPADIIAAAMAGRAFGWNPVESVNNFHVIKGKASMTPVAMLSLVRRAGHSVQYEVTESSVTAIGKRADNGDEMSATFTLEDAQRAGLTNNRNWQQYPEAMLQWRAISKLCRGLFSDAVSSAGYVPEELGAEVTEEGEVIEVEEVSTDTLVAFEPNHVVDKESPMANALAKQIVLDHLGGDQKAAKTAWGDRESITAIELSDLLETL